MNGIITLTTDFGTADGYVGAMKGVMTRVDPGLALHDIAHALPAQDVAHAAHVVAQACPWFPPGTVHLVVVDPGVGTARAAIAASAGGHVFVGPDNGVLWPALVKVATAFEPIVARRIERPAGAAAIPSHTFHGRDIFAPVAARIAAGRLPFDAVGPVQRPTSLDLPTPEVRAGRVAGVVIHVDRFGNLVTNIDAVHLDAIGAAATVCLPGGQRLPMSHTYADVPPGAVLALVGSDGALEIAVRDGSACVRLALAVGARIEAISR